MFDIEYADDVVILAETLSFSETAQHLCLSRSAVSRHVDAVEKGLGVRLFRRTTRKVELTEIGAAVLGDIDAVRKYRQRIARRIEEYRNEVPVLRLTSPDFWLNDYIEPLVNHIATHDASFSVAFESHDPIRGLELVKNGVCDVAFGVGLPTQLDPSLTMRWFADERLLVVACTECPFAHQDSISLHELVNLPLVLLDDGSGGFTRMNEAILELFHLHGLQPASIRYTRRIETQRFDIAACHGYTLAPASMRHVSRDYLMTLDLEGIEAAMPLNFFFRVDRLDENLMQFLNMASSFEKARGN